MNQIGESPILLDSILILLYNMEAEIRSLKDLIKDYAEWKKQFKFGEDFQSEIEFLEKSIPTKETEQDCSTPLLEDL